MKTLIRAAENKQRGRQFDMPALGHKVIKCKIWSQLEVIHFLNI